MAGLDSLSEKPLFQQLSDRMSQYNLRSHGPDILRKYAKLLVIAAVLVFVFLCRNLIAGSVSHVSTFTSFHGPVAGNPIYNSTLGFQAIYALVLPSRSDRKGPLIGTGNATNLTLTVLDAVLDKEVSTKDLPPKWGEEHHDPGELGCLMSHMKTWQMMVRDNIGSALLVESDGDWDMRIKQSMHGLSEGVKAIADFPFEPEIHQAGQKPPKALAPPPDLEPYGDKWDLLWIGHCGGNNYNGDGRYYAYNDSSAAPEGHTWGISEGPSEAFHRPGNTRLVYQLNWVVCTTGYAISNRGARKMVEKAREVNAPVDIFMRDHCISDPDLVCLSVYPQIISLAVSKSNIHHEDDGEKQGEGDKEENAVVNAGIAIQISARLNGHLGLANQGPEKWRKQWEDKVVEDTKATDKGAS